MSKRVLVTGINGFVGRHMARELVAAGHVVVGSGYAEPLAEELNDKVSLYEVCDLTDPDSVEKLSLDGIEAVVNLAGIAINNPNESDKDFLTRVNVLAHTNLYDRLVEVGRKIRIVAVSTGAVYDPGSVMPLAETSPTIDPTKASAYINSKLKLEEELEKYKDSLDIIIARPFNHTGPGQRPGFLIPDWAERFLHNDHLDVSRLDTWRDFTDVRDVVNAYRLLVESDELNHPLYNIASNNPQLGYDVISMLSKEFDLELPNPRVEGKSVIYGSHERLSEDTGWQPSIDITQTIHDFAEWRKKQS